jgi:hypothetical protein
MAERFAWHFAEIKAADPSRFVMTCNHGNLFQDLAATKLGQDLQLYAGVSDGWEMGQIMSDEDADRYNLMWMRAAGSFGKPLCPVRLAYKKTNPRARGGGTSYTPEAAQRYFWESVGTGAWHLGFIQWRGSLPDGEWGVKGTPAEAEIGRLFREWQRLGPYFDDAWPVKEPVGLYLSQPTWTLDGFAPLWTRLHREFTQRQIGYRVLCDEQLLSGELGTCKVVVCAENRVISWASLAALRKFVESGGLLVLVEPNGRQDELLRPFEGDPFAKVRGANVVALPSDSPTLLEDLERLIEKRRACAVRVTATADGPYYEAAADRTTPDHDTAFDLAAHRSLGQTILTTADGLSGVTLFNPTYTKKVTNRTLTLEVLADGPEGRRLAVKTFPAEELTDNAAHEVRIEPPAPQGTYYVRLLTPEGLPPQTLGVWGRHDDAYPGGRRFVDDAPAAGDLEVKLSYQVARPAQGALEAFTLSDGLNALVVLTNLSGLRLQARVEASPDLLPADVAPVRVTELASDADLGLKPRERLQAEVAVPAHRSAVLFLAAEGDGRARERLARLKAQLERLPEAAAAAPQAHLRRAEEALAAGRHAKALACLQRAEERVPMVLTARVTEAKTLDLRAQCFGVETDRDAPAALETRLVPLPGKTARLAKTREAGVYSCALSLADLGVRYDYTAREYVPYFGAVEVDVTGRFGRRAAAASCVVNVTR